MFFRFIDDETVRAAAVEGAERNEYGELSVIYAVMGDYENSAAPVELYTKEIEIFGWAVLPENPELKITETEIENDSEVEDELVPIDLGSSEGLGENFTENNFNGIAFSPAKTLGDEGFAMVSLLSLEDEGIMPLDVEPPLNVREYILNNSTGVVVKWHEYHEDMGTGSMPWKDLPTDGTEIPANAHLRVEVKYANVKPEDLAASGYQMVYVPDSLMTGLLADGDILVNNVPHGTITVEEVEVDGKMQRVIVLRFDPEWVNGLVSSNSDPNNTSNKRTISGDFYFQGELDLENLDDAENKELNLGPIRIQLPVKENAAARYAEATVEKGDPTLVSEVINGKTCYFLEYTLDVTTGKYGIPDIKVTDTITNKTATINGAQVEFIGSHPYVGLREAQLSSAVTVSGTPGAQNVKPVETVTLGTNGQLAQSTRNGQLYYTSKPNYSDTGYAEPDPAGESLVWDIGDMAPNTTRTVTYSMTLDSRTAAMGNNVGIDNRAEIHDDDTKDGGNKRLNESKANQIGIYIPTLYTNTQPVFQVVCRVTDPNSYFEDVQLTNVAKLYDARGLEIDARSSTIWARNGSLSKEDLVSSGNTLNTNILPYELVLNETAGDMQPGADVVGVPLIDHMSSNLSVNMETLKIYAGSVSPENLIYSGENERTAITAGTQRLYYAVDEDGKQLYWQGTPAAHTTDEATDFRVITTKANAYGTTTQINANDSFYYVASTGQEVIGAGTFEETETAFNDATGIPSGNYIIKSAQGTPYVTDKMTAQPRLVGAANREDATVFKITNNGSTYTVTSNGKYMSIPADQKALMQNDVQNLFIQKFTANFNNKAVRFCNADIVGTVQYLNRQNGNVQFGGYSNANGNNSAFYLYKEQSQPIAANTALYWDENAAIGTTPTDYPVITTNPAASLIGAHFELLSKDAGTNQVQGNVPNAFHKVNEYGQPLYRTADGTETTDAAGNTPIMVTTTIRVAVEPYVNEAGVADGTKIIKFYELPDSTKLIIKYDVSASLVTGGSGNSYSNSAYWDEHTASGDGITGSDNMVLDVEGTATAEVHGAVKITKYNGSNTAQKLSGAEFTLYRAAYIMGAPGSEWTLIETKNPQTSVITTSYQQNTGAAQYPAIYSVTEVNGQKVDTPMHPVRDVEGNLRGFMINGQFVNIQDNSLATMTFEHKLDKTDDGKLKLDPTILGQKTTGADGIVSYGFDAKESNIHFNKVYAIKETVAPEGYDLDQTIYYFVVPNQNLGGIGMNYFYHNNESDFPEEVHIVRRSEVDVLTYFLDVYDYKGTVQVMKEFGGNSTPDGNYKEGTYRFGIWPAKYVDANGVPWGNDYRLDTGAISYASTDFGMFKTVNGSQNWTEYRQNGNRWQSRSFTFDADGNETASEWAFISNPPTDLEYGILPNCRKVITFSNLTFNEDYYIFELDSNDFPILSSGTVGNDKFYVSYGTPVGQDPIYIPGTDKLAVDGNRVTPYKGQPGSIVVPVVIATNRSYELSITKNFTDNDEQLAEGIIGTYKFGIWKLPMTEPMTERNAFSTANIYFHKGDRVPSKTVYFRNLDPGSYAVCEIDENGNAVQNNELITVEGKTFNKGQHN